MTVHTNKILVQRYYEEMWNTWNFALTDELLSAEISFRGSLGVEALCRMVFCEYKRQVRNGFPDFHNRSSNGSREIPAEKAEAMPEIPMDAYLAACSAGRLKRSLAPRGPSGYCGGRLRNECPLW